MDGWDKEIKRLIILGKSYIQIASILHLNSEAVASRARKMGIKPKRHKSFHYRESLRREKSELVSNYELKESPVIMARILVFGERLQERNGTFYLDSNPIKTQNIIIEANKRLKAWGMEQIGHDNWRV